MRILAIGTHYDDVEIGCGGTLVKHNKMGDDIWIAIIKSDEHRTGSVSTRYVEQREASKFYGVDDRTIIEFSDLTLPGIISDLDRLNPDIVFTHTENDTHQDHREASIIGQAVGRKKHITTAFYDSGSSFDFYPNVFSLIDFDIKLKMLECFKSQIERNSINIDIIKKKNSYWASLIEDGDNYAEGFVVRKMGWMI